MQYLIRVVSDEVEDFRRDILIDEDATFLELSNILLKSCGYPDDQMTSFYVCNEDWERGEQITREDVRESANDHDNFAMADTELSEFLDDGGVSHLEYVFDPFNDRTFSLSVRDERPGSGAAEVVKSVGKAPQQIAELDFTLSTTALDADFSDDFSQEGYNADEIDLEGFEISEDSF